MCQVVNIESHALNIGHATDISMYQKFNTMKSALSLDLAAPQALSPTDNYDIWLCEIEQIAFHIPTNESNTEKLFDPSLLGLEIFLLSLLQTVEASMKIHTASVL